MPAFNEVQKRRRALVSQKKRNIHGDPITKKLKRATQPHSVSGKRNRKNLKKWRRDQKEAVEKGLISLQDVDMTPAIDGSAQDAKNCPAKFHLKKTVKLKAKQRKHKGKNTGESSQLAAGSASIDAMAE